MSNNLCCFSCVVSPCTAAAAPSAAVFNALSVPAAASCAAVPSCGKCQAMLAISMSGHPSVGIHSMNGIIQNLIIQNQFKLINSHIFYHGQSYILKQL